MNYPSNPDSWIGRFIGDNQRYRLDERLGGGGMGDVFLATDTRIGVKVALKLLKETLITVDELKKRFEREVTISAALKNLHIVEVSDYGVTSQGHLFYVMEYLRGKTLGKLLQEKERLSVEETVNIISQVCEGLRHAHEGVTVWRDGGTKNELIQVVHRDLKPDNIFIVSTDKGDLVKILDFGIAKVRSDSFEQTNLTQTTAFLGTVRYSSPEQLRGIKEIDGRADIYSLGIIIYQMLTGNDPFGFSTQKLVSSESSWILAHISDPPLSLRQQPGCEHLSPQLEAVVMKCLQKQAYERFSSVDELKRALLDISVIPPTNNSDITIPQRNKTQISPEIQVDNDKNNENNISQYIKLGIKIFSGIIFIFVFGIGTNNLFLPWLRLEKIKSLSNERDFSACIAEAQNFAKNSFYYSESQTYLQKCANQAVENLDSLRKQAKFKECKTQAQKIPKEIPNYYMVEEILAECKRI